MADQPAVRKLTLPLLSTPRTGPSAAARLSARGALPGGDRGLTPRDTMQASARQMLKPQVGVGRMVSALGNTRPAWEERTPRRCAELAREAMDAIITPSPHREYHVGRARARVQLRQAMDTNDEEAQLRRLEQALEIPAVQYDQALIPDLHKVVGQAAELSVRLNSTLGKEDVVVPDQALLSSRALSSAFSGQLSKDGRRGDSKTSPSQPAAQAAAGAQEQEQEQDELAGLEDLGNAGEQSATRIQAAFRGKKDRKEVQQKKEEKAAIVKIQARYRGKAARNKTSKIIQERYSNLVEQEDDGAHMGEMEEEEEQEN
mmetsp:Transcript_13706/g.35213  ORF Transcript_13706/g.35213 Transcript_13706/m.35213 type:complete len:316 (-) Transcript_13706:148-1095(-)